MPRKTFPYPLHFGDLDAFTHPIDGDLAKPFHEAGMVFAGNGYLSIRCHRGLWMPSDFDEPTPEGRKRILGLPWDRIETLPDKWRATDDITGIIFRYAQVGLWLRNRLAPSPVWRINETHLVRLSLLQLVASLPRCEIYTGPGDRKSHLPFRFSGGVGFIANDDRLTTASMEIFKPERCMFDGHILERGPRPTFKMFKDWPPAEPIDD